MLIVTIEEALPQQSVNRITDSRLALGLSSRAQSNNAASNFPDNAASNAARTLNSDDVELVRMLLKEGHTNLDNAYALHYAVAYCDTKTMAEMLDLGIADVNCRNLRGYTVLPVAATSKEPKTIVSLPRVLAPRVLSWMGGKLFRSLSVSPGGLQIFSSRMMKASLLPTTACA
ncbi:hypothetical protein M0R45_003588 [Rubus argutus]|uniref:Ankyrin repeat protein n=1 Tax=Rubus argutus TaxID=59490 RepID=A0AAW1YGN7_RUBAR